MGNLFKIRSSAFEKMISGFIRVVWESIYDDLVLEYTAFYSMKRLVQKGNTFNYFPHALYATDVTFQQSNRPSGVMAEGKAYYSGKHKLYGLKVEVSVFPNGLANFCSNHYGRIVGYFKYGLGC